MKQTMEAEARLQAFREAKNMCRRESIPYKELAIRIDELLWVLEQER
jgi:hypothetical protein